MKDGRELGEIANFHDVYADTVDADRNDGHEISRTVQFIERFEGEHFIRQSFALESIAESLSELLRRGAGR